jgi:hypothetical protein
MLVDITDSITAGTGTYERNGVLYSSLAGYTAVEKSDDTQKVGVTQPFNQQNQINNNKFTQSDLTSTPTPAVIHMPANIKLANLKYSSRVF